MSPSTSSFDDTTENMTDWLRLHGRAVAIGVGAVAVLLAGTAVWRSSQNSRSERADAQFFQAQQVASTGDQAAAERELRQVAQRYSGTAGGTQAQLALAQLLYDQGKYQDGLKVLDDAGGAPKSLTNAVRVLKAAGNEGLGKYKEAAKQYEDAAGDASSSAEKYEFQASAARSYQSGGDRESSIRLWRELATIQEPGVADEARVRLGELLAAGAK